MSNSLTTYALIKKLESLDYFPQLITSGLFPMNWLDYKTIFEFYENEVKRLTLNKDLSAQELRQAKRTAKTITSEEFRIGESTVYQIIQKMT